MTFFDPPKMKPPHICEPPEPSVLQPEGWRCDCGKAYVKVQESQHGKTWWDWRRSPGNDT